MNAWYIMNDQFDKFFTYANSILDYFFVFIRLALVLEMTFYSYELFK